MLRLISFFKQRIFPYFLKFYSCIGIEFKETKELLQLIRKSLSKPLNEDEHKKVVAQVIDICKMIPLIIIFIFPGGGLILAIIFKFLPKKIIYPSAFLENNV